MALTATLHRFRIALSDIDRSLYDDLDFRLARHPSETEDYLLTRVMAYALNYDSRLVVAPGLCANDEPALHLPSSAGGIQLWIEIGNPSARRLHRASKAARQVRVYTYKDPENIKREMEGEKIHRASEIGIFALEPRFLASVAGLLKRDNTWSLIHQEGELTISVGEVSLSGSLHSFQL